MVRKRQNVTNVTEKTDPKQENIQESDPPLIKMRFVIHLLTSACMAATFWGFITDEHSVTHNIEPLHSIIYGKSIPFEKNSIFSYSYISLYIPVVSFFKLMGGPKGGGYFIIRIFTSLLSVLSLLYFYKNTLKRFGGLFSAVLIISLLFCPVMFISAAEMLTESFSMLAVFVFLAFWLSDDIVKALLVITSASIVAWPFILFLAFPLILYRLCSSQRHKMISDLKMAGNFVIFCVLIPVLLCEYYYRGEIVLPAIDHFYAINILGMHFWGNLWFYLKSCFVNFGLCFPLTLISIPIFFLHRRIFPKSPFSGKLEYLVILVTPLLGLLALCWIIHEQKDRFIFPLFPFFLLSSTVSVHLLQEIFNITFKGSHLILSNFNLVVLILQFASGMIRIVGTYYALSAPINGYMAVNGIPHSKVLAQEDNIRFCVQELKYFPSNFLLPQNNWTTVVFDGAFGQEKFGDFESCHFIAGLDNGEVGRALRSGDWTIFYNSSMSVVYRGDPFWWEYFPSFWKGYSDSFYILSSEDYVGVVN